MPHDEFRSEMPAAAPAMPEVASPPNAALVRRIHAAFHAGDLEALGRELDDEVLWHTPGSNLLAGDHRGRDQVLELMRKAVELTSGTLHVDLMAAFGDQEFGVLWLRTTASRGNQRLDMKEAIVFAICDGRVTEAWQRPDQARFDAFFG